MGPASAASQTDNTSGTQTSTAGKEANGWLHDPDVQLMLRTQQGDRQAFEQLVLAYQDRLVGIFTHMIGSQEAAEDLAQEVFLRVYRSRERYKPKAKFSTWLFHIANNLAKNARRSLGRRKEVSYESRPTDQSSGDFASHVADKSGLMPTRQLARRELQGIVQDALDTLSDRQRMAVLLHKFEGMSYADIGQAMELSPAAVKSLLSRARENLRMKLESQIQ
ncbi:RNA polymerase sigma factor [Thalassoroseus pseudoceratinae]|uniref:RNA polymerase sigma factor n=1 Tax=Thalassoroseus pseudoceratinae TaxID=2713176 RepID=UPI001F0FCEC1|nr:sigma-70 family RNA polymerase sigma factor [Thalassoroseus pseudoceratinae]